MKPRKGAVNRETSETAVRVELTIDGTGAAGMSTGIRMFDHLLTQVSRHGLFDLTVSSSGDNQHHIVEDVAICMGRALNEALGDKSGIVRMAHAIVPMDDALSLVAIDISGRGGAHTRTPFACPAIGDLESDMVRHFLLTFASEAKLSLHATVECGENDHHKAESLFKALGRALDLACSRDERRGAEVPSSKGILEH
ncbi:MAG: imidazoleglycerol-phosphate dehydratase HisB [Chloroflexota bacterium]